MPITKKPDPLPSDLTYVPPESEPHRVTNGESFFNLAELPAVKAKGLSPLDLCYFNFRTRKPAEINWYLYHKVGCRTSTRDGNNYMFSMADDPGVIYLPKEGAPLPPHEFPPAPPGEATARSNCWFGLGGKAGTMFAVVGIETVVGAVASLDEPGKFMGVTASVNRLGAGVGASGGICFIYISGVRQPSDLTGHQQMDGDFNLSLGGNWGKAVKTAKAAKLGPLIEFIGKLGARTPDALKGALKAHPDRWVELIKAGKSVAESLGIDPNGPPNVFMFDVPFIGAGVEASLFYGLSNFNAVWDGG